MLAAVTLAACRLGAAALPAAALSSPLDNQAASARAVAMGNAFVAVADDAGAVLDNPAGLALLSHGEAGMYHNSWLAGTFQDTAALGLPLGRAWGSLGLSAGYFSFGNLQGYDASGNATGGYSGGRAGLGLAWAKALPGGLDAGLAVKGQFENIAGQGGSAFGGDLGLLWNSGPLRLGVSYTNLGSASDGSALASGLNAGASYRLELSGGNHLLLAGAVSIEPQAVNRVRAGAEENFRNLLFARVGYDLALADNQLEGLTGVTAGLGFRFSGFQVDYAFQPFGQLGVSQRVGLTYDFGEPEAAPAKEAAKKDAGDVAKWRAAAAGYRARIQKHPKDEPAWKALAKVYLHLGYPAYAKKCLEQAVKLNPADAEARSLLK